MKLGSFVQLLLWFAPEHGTAENYKFSSVWLELVIVLPGNFQLIHSVNQLHFVLGAFFLTDENVKLLEKTALFSFQVKERCLSITQLLDAERCLR